MGRLWGVRVVHYGKGGGVASLISKACRQARWSVEKLEGDPKSRLPAIMYGKRTDSKGEGWEKFITKRSQENSPDP